MQRKLLGIINVDFDIIGQILTIYSAFVTYVRKKNGNTINQLFIYFMNPYDSIWREVLYYILFEFCIPMKLIQLIKLFLNETCSRVRVGKHLSDTFHIKYGFKQEEALLPLLFKFARVCH